MPKLLFQEQANQYITDNWDRLLSVCRSVTRDEDRALEAMNEIVFFQLPRLLERWDSELGTLEGFITYSLRLYVWSWIERNEKRFRRITPFTASLWVHGEAMDEERAAEQESETYAAFAAIENQELVNAALAEMDEYPRWLVVAKVVDGLNFEEMAELLNVSKGTAFNHYNNALLQFREICKAKI